MKKECAQSQILAGFNNTMQIANSPIDTPIPDSMSPSDWSVQPPPSSQESATRHTKKIWLVCLCNAITATTTDPTATKKLLETIALPFLRVVYHMTKSDDDCHPLCFFTLHCANAPPEAAPAPTSLPALDTRNNHIREIARAILDLDDATKKPIQPHRAPRFFKRARVRAVPSG